MLQLSGRKRSCICSFVYSNSEWIWETDEFFFVEFSWFDNYFLDLKLDVPNQSLLWLSLLLFHKDPSMPSNFCNMEFKMSSHDEPHICENLQAFVSFFLHLLHVDLDIWHGDMVLVVLIWVCSLKYLCSWAWNDTCRGGKKSIRTKSKFSEVHGVCASMHSDWMNLVVAFWFTK
jgi:hypothetical protein